MTKIERESINFKLPKTLTAALRKAAKERNTTATDLVIGGLHHVLGDVPGTETSVEIRLHQLEEKLQHLADSIKVGADTGTETRLSSVEQKLEAVTTRLAQLEGAIAVINRNQNTAQLRRKSSYSAHYYSGETPQLMPFREENLVLRLVSDTTTLRNKRETLSQSEFIRWCKDRDPSGMGWEFNEKDGLYHPVK